MKGNCTWSLEGKGASVDATTGVVTMNTDTELGTWFMLTATPENGGVPVSKNLQTALFGFDAATIKTEEKDGFTYPVMTGVSWERFPENEDYWICSCLTDDGSGLINQEDVYLWISKIFVHDEASAIDFYEDSTLKGEEMQSRKIWIDGAMAYIYTWKELNNKHGWSLYCGRIEYVRNNGYLVIQFLAGRQNEPIDDVQPITLDWLENIASLIHYEEPEDIAKLEDAQLTLNIENDAAPVLSQGKKLQLIASFANPEKINSERRNDGILWSVTDAVTGEETNAATISEGGLLTAAKKLNDATTVRVTATAEYFQTTATIDVDIYPPVMKIETDPKEVFLYDGSDKTVMVKAILTPDSIPPTGITWQLKKEGIAEVTPTEDGTAVFRAVSAGKTAVTVTEPSGKKTMMNVSVVPPVEDIELNVMGKQIPGGTVTVKGTILPKEAGNKAMEWSLDVSEDIATINQKGQVKIAKTAPAGTVITVTCKALGAPEPIIKTIPFEIAEK